MKGVNKFMDSIDKKIKEVLSKDLIEPFGYEQKIKKALYKEEKKKVSFTFKLVKTVSAACAGVILSTGIVFASYNIYEKIWKEPKEYNSYEDYQANSELQIKNDEINREIELEKAEKNGEIISEEEAVKCANEILQKLGYEFTITKENIKYDDMDSKHSYNLYYVIRTGENINSGMELKLGANGEIYSFTNRDIEINYNIKPEKIEEKDAINLAEDLLRILGFEDKYVLNSAEEISHYFKDEEKKEWWVTFIRDYNGITNSYERIQIDFYVENNEIKLEQFIKLDSKYKIDNNQIEIDKENAINIAKEKDSELTNLKIEDIEVTLEFRPLNSFVYAQEETNGGDDGLVIEKQENGTNVGYNKYDVDSNILRKVWNVKIKYKEEFSKEVQATTWKEQFGREYFIDATTGEIIGGRWGENLY